ncbi:hypothetical protein [Mixta intestinalis]|uniref:Bacteriophage protein n=1 Tax=Mixta intestinalis TaxID=1615494 RepID=A0A6P1PZR6_9GAMM|nr:hypothetical protein [Mixta intestinalis]QHM71268.1 hypothetical protein C7M51_01554 [Mixta intestinalis]
MRYRRENENGDYTFGQGDNTWLINSPEAVAQAVKTRLALWRGQWFLDTTAGTPWRQTVLGKPYTDAYYMALRQRILSTPGVREILSFTVNRNPDTRRITFTARISTLYGETSVNSEA